MHRILKKLKKISFRLYITIYNLFKVIKYGGYSTVNISQINYGGLLKGKKILITGGSSGIGFSIAQKCISEGAQVIITGRNEESLRTASNKINSPLLKYINWDVSDISKVESRLATCKELLNGKDIDILINNAGVVNGVTYPNVTEDIWNEIYSINLKGLFFLTQNLCHYWEKNNDKNNIKKVINISSQGGFVGALYPYRMTKWDIVGLTQGLGMKLAPKGIIINGIAPGITATSAVNTQFYSGDKNTYCPNNPLKRVALPEEIAELAVFLMNDATNFIVGHTIVCDGGYSLK
ncbi:SDR family NAD(P)-dependent oxidoreductase [Celerinatantimonas diazotrophica]|uniref:3-oxoacyl-[acyl-carrier protein] reductase n=1 Tax=Celerinatantimonas diazotrophica TaxID=412034 RepID=A0A4V2PRI9_9GAMM|nr:SDR family oxidoreductase [Celerinatantimonas diazotrophica]TCK59081.1 3-oxoacyl-[acyl-carrier protein] reductase [Celerinatantimonas diazotrophica]CAG9297719.1 3-oxoacyl-[acyl-carrier-protein] reductase FabG [Celerinatantimonas diazotrophica]